MLTFKAEILKNKARKDGTYNVKIRIVFNREVKRLSTDIFVSPEDLTKSFKIKNHKIQNQVDKIVRNYQDICAEISLTSGINTIDDVVDYINNFALVKQFYYLSEYWNSRIIATFAHDVIIFRFGHHKFTTSWESIQGLPF